MMYESVQFIMTMQCNLKRFTLETITSPIRIRLENTYCCEIISPVVVLIACNAVGTNIVQLPTHHRLYFFPLLVFFHQITLGTAIIQFVETRMVYFSEYHFTSLMD